MAWVILKPDHEATGDDLRRYCQNKIAHNKVPRYWRFTDSFPMTVTGKIQKFKLREIAIQELGLERAAKTRTAYANQPLKHFGSRWESKGR